MDPSLATVIVAAIAAVTTSIVAPIVTFVIKYMQDKKIAERVVQTVENVGQAATENAAAAEGKMNEIHHLVNGRLAEALERIAVLEKLLRAERADHKP